MDFRDILKSFDNLSEGEKTTTDKGTVHKAGPGGYGNKHGSEDVTDQYGKPVGRMSLGKLGAKNEPKRGKGRPPNPDKAKEYDSTGLNKAMGIGKAPKPTGKPSVKHSLKEYFDQMDEALSEAGLAVQPMPATPQQKQQQAVATKPSFMIKDPANPNMPAITTQDPAVVQAAKNGTMSMQKPGAAPTTQPGATPATGAGSQVGAMAEEGGNWIKGAIKHPGAFTAKAKSHGMTPAQFRAKVLAHKEDYPAKTEKQAQLAKTLGKMHNESDMDEAAKWRSPEHKGKLYTQEPGDSDDYDDMDYGYDDYGIKQRPENDPGQKRRMGGVGDDQYNTDPLLKWHRRSANNNINTQGKRAGLPSRDQITGLKQSIKNVHGQHKRPNLPEAEAPQHFAQSSPLSTNNRGVLEGKKGVNPFAKKDTKKKPDENNNNIPDYAEDGKGKNDLKKKGAAPKKGVNPFAKKDEKKKVKEGMDSKLQAARLRGKSHALAKEAYNCHYDDMEEARCYHEGFKEGLDECYGQVPIQGMVGENEIGTMASYGATGLGEMDKTSYMKQQAIKTPGNTFKAFGQTMNDRDVIDEFAFEAFDKQLNALLESEEKVSEGMTVSISKGQQGSPDSVSVSAQDGEADQLLSIIKSAGMGLFGGEEQGFNAPQGTAGAHGGISVVDDHDGMMALMKKLSGGAETSSGDFADEEGSEEEHMHGEEGHSHEGEEPCNECGMMECGCEPSGGQQVVDEVESEDQMEFEVAEANAPDSGAAETAADDASEAGEDAALATDDAAQDEEEAQVYSSPTNEAEDDEEEDDKKDFFHNPNVPADKQLKAPPKEVNVAESFSNLYKKLALLSEESTSEKDDKAEKAAKEVAKDIEYDEGHKGKDDDKAEEAGKKVKKDIEYDDKKDKKEKKLDEWANEAGKNGTDASFEADIDFMTKVISGGLNKQKSTGQTTIPVINGQKNRMGVDGLGSPMKESTDLLKDYLKLSGL